MVGGPERTRTSDLRFRNPRSVWRPIAASTIHLFSLDAFQAFVTMFG
jgi:hypothetical protein